ncbi:MULTISPECIES: DUF4870 domain-containing protein [unclassified Lysinibacillus]|uniref:DUF4870 domain-containing protein n=1 Tax=unclassified Lysinibacillus TaxID=2636778 RepID=UPI002012F18C|nr:MULTISPECIES: DUF4870 domain-containing protein [unclassified Lysinibacillus]MCL1697903.1 DUF4870 domain-containing protein [Lysinibacillus sp. BPa_S21]MCL1702841.1 DUF4870 domain-containing protein [Lysinibacillus sp. Bpr_S20]
MENQKILSAFSYLSILFAPFIVPLIVYFVAKDSDVKSHSIRALISHLIPVAFGIILFAVFIFSTLTFNNLDPDLGSNKFLIIWLVSFGIYFLVSIGVVIWNIIQAVRVVR